MPDPISTISNDKTEPPKEAVAVSSPSVLHPQKTSHDSAEGGFRDRRKNQRRPQKEGRTKPEFDQKIISIRRVTRVAAGGRRFSFSVALVAGNKKGEVGVGIGKGGDTALAIEKAFRDAKKNMISVKRTKHFSIPHYVEAKYSSSVIKMMPSPGNGLVAGSSVRNVLELAGVKDVNAKIMSRSKNKLNNARVAVLALSRLSGSGAREVPAQTR